MKKTYEIKPHQKVDALERILVSLHELEDTASLTGEGEHVMWAYQETRSLIRKRIQEVAS